MFKCAYLFTLASFLACAMHAAPAQAQRARDFVASYGVDGASCGAFLSPCRTFQQAVSNVVAGGEVTAIDSAGFGTVTINKAVTISSPPGIEASIAANPGGTAIAIAAGVNDIVTLRGLTLNGSGTAGNGINFTAGAKLAVIDCFVSNYAQYGILVHPSATGNTLILVSNTTVTETAGGIVLETLGTGGISATFAGLTLDNNTDSIELVAEGGPINLMVSNTQIGHNSEIGIYSTGGSGGPGNILYLKNVTFSGDMPHEIYLDINSQIWLSQVTQQVNDVAGAGIYCAGGGDVVYTDQTNHINGFGTPQCGNATNPLN